MEQRLVVLVIWSTSLILAVSSLLLHPTTSASRLLGERHGCIADTDEDAEDAIRFLASSPVSQRLPCFRFATKSANDSLAAVNGGGLVLAAMLPLHKSPLLAGPHTCTEPRARFMVELVEALKLAVREELSVHPVARQLVKHIQVHDSCVMPEAAVEAAIKIATLTSRAGLACLNDLDASCQENPDSQRVVAVIGPAQSEVVEAVAPILSTFEIPLTSFWSTSDQLAEKSEFPFLFRTTSSDMYQAAALLDVLEHFNWRYIYLFHDAVADSYSNLANAFHTEMSRRVWKPCLALDRSIHFRDVQQIQAILDVLYRAANSGSQWYAPSVIALLGGSRSAEVLFEEMELKALENETFREWIADARFVWLAGDGWISEAAGFINTKRQVSIGHHTVLGTVFHVPRAEMARNFEQRLVDQLTTVYPNHELLLSNPWLAGTWQKHFDCRLPFLDCDTDNCTQRQLCNTSISIAEAFSLQAGNLSVPVSSGSLMLAVRATIGMIETAFSGRPSPSVNLSVSGSDLLLAMKAETRQCDFDTTGELKTCPTFLDNQDMMQSFRVQGLIKVRDDEWVLRDIANWSSVANRSLPDWRICFKQQLEWWAAQNNPIPTSLCNDPCAIGSAARPALQDDADIDRSSCCVVCVPCQGNEYFQNSTGSCRQCPRNMIPVDNRTACMELPENFIDFTSAPGIAVLGFALVMLSMTVACAVLLYHHRKTTVVRAAHLQSCLLLCVSIFSGLLISALFYAPPTALVCDITVVLVYGNIFFSLILLNARLLRLVHATNGAHVWKWLRRLAKVTSSSDSRQLVVILALAGLLFVALLITELQRTTQPKYNNHGDRQDVSCARSPDSIFLASVFWFFLLIPFCVFCYKARHLKLQAVVKNRGVPNEASLLGFTAFVLTLIWVSMTPISYLTREILSPVVTSVAFVLHQAALLSCMLLSWVYAILRGKQHARPPRMRIRKIQSVRGESQNSLRTQEVSPVRPSSLRRQPSRLCSQHNMSESDSTASMYVTSPVTSPHGPALHSSVQNGSVANGTAPQRTPLLAKGNPHKHLLRFHSELNTTSIAIMPIISEISGELPTSALSRPCDLPLIPSRARVKTGLPAIQRLSSL